MKYFKTQNWYYKTDSLESSTHLSVLVYERWVQVHYKCLLNKFKYKDSMLKVHFTSYS